MKCTVVSELLSQIDLLAPAVSGLVGVALGGFLTSWNQRKERKERFISDQLREFYGPMLAIREGLRARNDVRVKVSEAAHQEWPRLVKEAPDIHELRKHRSAEYEKIIDYENEQLRNETIPLYAQMVKLFTEKMYLAESSTRRHFPALVEFVEMWNRVFQKALPPEVSERVGPNDISLEVFYRDLETNFERLQRGLRVNQS